MRGACWACGISGKEHGSHVRVQLKEELGISRSPKDQELFLLAFGELQL